MGIHSRLELTPSVRDDVTLVTAVGVLDSTTYLRLRDYLVKTAVDEPVAVVVDVSELEVPAASAWMVFLNAYWQVNV